MGAPLPQLDWLVKGQCGTFGIVLSLTVDMDRRARMNRERKAKQKAAQDKVKKQQAHQKRRNKVIIN